MRFVRVVWLNPSQHKITPCFSNVVILWMVEREMLLHHINREGETSRWGRKGGDLDASLYMMGLRLAGGLGSFVRG